MANIDMFRTSQQNVKVNMQPGYQKEQEKGIKQENPRNQEKHKSIEPL